MTDCGKRLAIRFYCSNCQFSSVHLFIATAYAEGLIGCEEHVKYGMPSKGPVLLCRHGYALSHNSEHKVPNWVVYHLTKEKMNGNHPRSNDFRPDPDLEPGQRADVS